MGQSLYMHTEPDSHFWTDLEQLIYGISFDIKWHNEKEENVRNVDDTVIDMYQPITKEYIIIGLKKSLKYGYEIKKCNRDLTVHGANSFFNIKGIINYLNSDMFSLYDLFEFLKNTIDFGYNLTNNIKMERIDVYKNIDTERKYQDLRWGSRRTEDGTPDEEKPPAEWINYIEYHISAAKNKVYHLNTEEALAHVRKVAALAVRCLELYGCPERIIPNGLE